jgi:flavin-dependent dehydrogenase
VTALRRVGLGQDAFREAALPIGAMRVESATGTTFRLTYGSDGSPDRSAVGFDRERLDTALLDMARGAGVDVRTGTTVTRATLGATGRGATGGQRLVIRDGNGLGELGASVVIGADGVRSTIARLAGVTRSARLGHRIGLTFHLRDPRPAVVGRDARMVIGDQAYCGLAPVPGGRVNVGIVLAGETWRRRLAERGAAAVAAGILAAIPPAPDDEVAWAEAERTDSIEGAAPLGHRVARRAGSGWLLVGDAAGFLDPLTGEGLHRALVSAALAAAAVDAHLAGRGGALAAYERAMARRFRAKDLVTLLIQAFVAHPPLFEHVARRLAQREPLRATMGLVIGDLVPATRALEPSFLAGLLGP